MMLGRVPTDDVFEQHSVDKDLFGKEEFRAPEGPFSNPENFEESVDRSSDPSTGRGPA